MKKRIPFIVLGILIAGAGIYLARQITGPGDRELKEVFGNVEIREVDLGFRVSGRVSKVLVEEGDAVEPGTVLAQIDREPYEHELAAAQARLNRAQAELERLKNGYRKEEIAEAKAMLEARAASLRNAQQQLKRQEKLISSAATSEQTLENARAAFDEAQAQFDNAQAKVDLVTSGFRAEEIAAAEASFAEAKAQVAQIQLQIEDTTLKAPSKGVLLTRIVEPGAFVGSGQTALTLSLKDRTWVRAFVPEPQLGKIKPGMKVHVRTDSQEKAYTGQVGFVAPTAEFTPKNVETTELRTQLVYRFRVVLDHPDDGLRQGMPVTVLFDR